MKCGSSLEYLFREFTCGCCGKTFVMPPGMDKENYVYQLNGKEVNILSRRSGKTETKVRYYCSWSCYKKAKAEVIGYKKRAREYDKNWLKWAGVINEIS